MVKPSALSGLTLAEAKLQAIAGKTGAHLDMYHAAVHEAQVAALLRAGLPPDLLHATPEEVEARLQEMEAPQDKAEPNAGRQTVRQGGWGDGVRGGVGR
eukprot:265991-Chlamydomonas_euryale.AAC.1